MVADVALGCPQPREDFASFYERYFPRLVSYVRRRFPAEDAEELAQETLARAASSYARLDLNRDPWPWLKTIVRHEAYDTANARKYANVVALRCAVPVETEDRANPEDVVVLREQCGILDRALAGLSVGDRRIVTMHHLEELSLHEIAAVAGCKENAVRQRLFRARARLAKAVTELGGTLAVVPVGRFIWRQAIRLRPSPVMTAPALAAGVAVLGVAGGAYLGVGGFGGTSTDGAAATSRLHAVVSAESARASEPVLRVTRPARPVQPVQPVQAAPERIAVHQQVQRARVNVEVTKNPLKSGKVEGDGMRVETPFGAVVLDGDTGAGGQSVVCALTSVGCDG